MINIYIKACTEEADIIIILKMSTAIQETSWNTKSVLIVLQY